MAFDSDASKPFEGGASKPPILGVAEWEGVAGGSGAL